jgi:hypothetical protein
MFLRHIDLKSPEGYNLVNPDRRQFSLDVQTVDYTVTNDWMRYLMHPMEGS